MKGGAENRTKTIALGVLGAIALCGLFYNASSLFGGPSTPPPAVAPLTNTPTPARTTQSTGAANTTRPAAGGAGAVPGVAAQKLASSATSLDPTLNQAAMLRTESLVYSGSGRNIFSALYVAAAGPAIPKNVPPARPVTPASIQPAYTGPPPPPPIPLKFFGTAQRGRNGAKEAFLLSGDDVYLASPGDIVAKRYKVGAIQSFGVTVTDLGSNTTQTLPLQQQ